MQRFQSINSQAPVFLAAADKVRANGHELNRNEAVSIHVPVLTRVEGEGALDLRIDNGEIAELRLRIFEPPRFFEKFLEGRHYTEVPDMVARICGICPVAYQVTAAQALEKLFGVELDPWARAMRRVFYCGEWIQSHSLHIHLLAAPDFFGCNNAIELARIAPDEVRRGLRIQALGNELMDLFGARSVHPVGVRDRRLPWRAVAGPHRRHPRQAARRAAGGRSTDPLGGQHPGAAG
ncbi:MAG: nickel-dependent hydrogenase large subunit [Comamonadaceae bacterium]|nr:nickel-dependent hydrogenase large subunit [Comamonadaceae bacterium]